MKNDKKCLMSHGSKVQKIYRYIEGFFPLPPMRAPNVTYGYVYKLNRARQLGQLSPMPPFLQGLLHFVVGAS